MITCRWQWKANLLRTNKNTQINTSQSERKKDKTTIQERLEKYTKPKRAIVPKQWSEKTDCDYSHTAKDHKPEKK